MSFDPEHDGYVESRYDQIDDPDKTLRSEFYIYDDNGMIKTVDKKDDETYTAIAVMTGLKPAP